MYMWIEFVVGSCACFEGFSLVPLVFLLPQNQHSKFQLNQQAVEKKSHLVECPLLSSHLFIYFI